MRKILFQNRVAGITQTLAVPVVAATTNHAHLGPTPYVLAAAYTATAAATIAHPEHTTLLRAVAATGTLYWALRAGILTYDAVNTGAGLWAEVATAALLTTLVALYYWRSLARTGFLHALDELETGLRDS